MLRVRLCGSLTIAILSLIKGLSLITYCIFQHSFHIHQPCVNIVNAQMQIHVSTPTSLKINHNLISFPLFRIIYIYRSIQPNKIQVKVYPLEPATKILDGLQCILHQVYLNSHLGIREHSAAQKAIKQGPECLPRVKSNNREVSNTLGKVKRLVPEARQQ